MTGVQCPAVLWHDVVFPGLSLRGRPVPVRCLTYNPFETKMNHLIETEGRVYLLAASAAGGRVAVYGQTLFEVCRFHELSLRRIRSVEAKALERGRYAFFMLSQIENFDSRDRLWALGRILLLCDSAIDTFESMENRERSLYREQVAACRTCRLRAAELLPPCRRP